MGGRPELERVFHAPLKDIITELHELNERGAGIFVVAQKTEFVDQGIENVLEIRAIVADFDGGLPGNFPLEPSYAVETSPGKFQCYWNSLFLSELSSVQIMERLVRDYGANGNAMDLARAVRVPGFYNRENVPFEVALHENSEAEFSGFYSYCELLKAFPPVPLAGSLRAPKSRCAR